jgi:hypothetical protein
MSTTQTSPRGSRASLWCGGFALPPVLVLAVVWVTQLIVLQGSDRFMMLTTLLVFALVGGLSLALAVLAIVFGRAGGQRVGVILGAAAIACIVVCLACFVVWNFG